MATKKEKRAAGEARASIQLAETIDSGLQAQRSDREARQRQAMKRSQTKLAADEASKKIEKTLVNLKKMNNMAPELLTTGS